MMRLQIWWFVTSGNGHIGIWYTWLHGWSWLQIKAMLFFPFFPLVLFNGSSVRILFRRRFYIARLGFKEFERFERCCNQDTSKYEVRHSHQKTQIEFRCFFPLPGSLSTAYQRKNRLVVNPADIIHDQRYWPTTAHSKLHPSRCFSADGRWMF